MMDPIRQAMAQEVVRLQRKLAASEKERDALAAHVEYLTSHFDEVERASLNQPTASLTRHDAELRADTLAEVLALARTMDSDKLIRELEYQGAELHRELDDETDRAR